VKDYKNKSGIILEEYKKFRKSKRKNPEKKKVPVKEVRYSFLMRENI